MQAFTGVRVLDFTHVLAGPFCTYQLAVMGAEVIKIESPNRRDMMRAESSSESLREDERGTQFLAQGGNKRSVTIDFTTERGLAVVKRLAATADVVVENFRTGVLTKAGLGYEALSAVNPRLIYCSMTGFGQTGPKASHPAYDNVIQAFSGLMAQTGSPSSAPVRVGPPVLDYGTGAQASFAIAAALFQRANSGNGQYIDVSMLDAALMLMSTSVVDTQIRDASPVPPGNSNPANAGYGCFDASEGLIMVGAFTPKQHGDLWRALGRADVAEARERLDSKARAQHFDEDRRLIAEILRGQTAQAWEDFLNQCGVPAARVRHLDETLRHPQIAARQALQQAPGLSAEHEALRMPVAAFSYHQDGPRLLTQGSAPGRHSADVLRELGLDDTEITQLENDGIIG